MKLTRAMAAMMLAATMGMGANAAMADGDGRYGLDATEVRRMADKDGMVAKKDFLALMEKKFDAMDKDRKGMLSTTDLMKIFRDNTGQ
jgi:hypothetical protein